MRISKMDLAHELFKKGKNYKEISQETGLKESTCKFYVSKFKTEGRPKKEKKEETVEEQVIKVHADTLRINANMYNLSYYLDSVDGSMWFDFIEIVRSLEKEGIINSKTFKTRIPDRYFRNEKVNRETVHLIDKVALIDFAKEVNDYTFTTSVIELSVGEIDNVFYKFNQILTSLSLINNVINGLDEKYEEMEAYNNAQFDLLHEYDNESFLTDVELLEKSKKMQTLRLNRRSIRNEVVLTKALRKLLRENGTSIAGLGFVKNKLNKLVDDLYSKKYNCRLEDWQKEIVELENNERLAE